jgi:hypothetical protein
MSNNFQKGIERACQKQVNPAAFKVWAFPPFISIAENKQVRMNDNCAGVSLGLMKAATLMGN